MRILYLSASYIPSQRASSVQVMKMCHAFAQAGHEVALLAKDAPAVTPGLDDYQFYGVAPNFRLYKLARPAFRGGGLWYAGAMLRCLRAARGRYDVVYSRDIVGATCAAQMGWPVIFEAHGVPSSTFWQRWHACLFRHPKLRHVVTISRALQEELVQLRILPADAPGIVAHDAADPEIAEFGLRIAEAGNGATGAERSDNPQIGYVGNLYAGRGVEVVADLAESWPHGDFHVIGGKDKELQAWRERRTPRNLHFHGFQPPARVAEEYRRFDMLLMPYQRQVATATGRSDTSRWMSPLKMFEYMATGRPIVASALPVLQEVLRHEHNALLAEPDDIAQWRHSLDRLATQPSFAQALGARARQDLLARYTWPARAAKVLAGLV